MNNTWTVPDDDDNVALSRFLRDRLEGQSWNAVKRLVTTGKVFVEGVRMSDPGHRLNAGQTVRLDMNVPRRDRPRNSVRILHADSQVVVIDKPIGLASVPVPDSKELHALELTRRLLRRRSERGSLQLRVVHRLDKATSGVMIFARSPFAERMLAQQFRAHTITRRYHALAHGRLRPRRIESLLVRNRGDGLRGSVPPDRRQGQRAVTHVGVLERFDNATLCQLQLETGRTHQIRIHLAEAGHPIVGESVYIRDFQNHGHIPLPSTRLMLHAQVLGFEHPASSEAMTFEAPYPADFKAVLAPFQNG